MSQYVKWVTVMLICIMLSVACKKDKTPISMPEPEPTKWEKIAGTYDVYDTTGVYLYELKLTPIFKENGIIDSLRFENFDGEFYFTTQQMYPYPDNMQMVISIGVHNELYDNNNKRWKLGGALYEDYNNYINDTIRLRFQKTNINYWVEDAVPYYACDCKQIAVKQH